jgi:hypothetical protein
METLEMKRARKTTTWRKNLRKSWRFGKQFWAHINSTKPFKHNKEQTFSSSPCSFQKFVWSPLFGISSNFHVWSLVWQTLQQPQTKDESENWGSNWGRTRDDFMDFSIVWIFPLYFQRPYLLEETCFSK